MKMQEALRIINKNSVGYMIHFAKIDGHTSVSDYFPDKTYDEKLFPNEEEAWWWAAIFANSTPAEEYVNIFVVDDKYCPVEGFEEKRIRPI